MLTTHNLFHIFFFISVLLFSFSKFFNSTDTRLFQDWWFLTDPLNDCLNHLSIWVYCFHQDIRCVLIIIFLVLSFGGNAFMGILYNSKISNNRITGFFPNSDFIPIKAFSMFFQTICFLPFITNVLINLLNQNDLNNKFL